MRIGIIKEEQDARVAIIPEVAKKIKEEGNDILVEKDAGALSFYTDQDYETAGATILSQDEILKESEVIISIHPLSEEALAKASGKMVISSFQPFADAQILDKLNAAKVSAMSLDMIPRITIAQAMDVLSSMASISGYLAVIEAAKRLPRYFPMLTTAAGSIPPSKILIIGAGVAGLQAIATAKRLGAVVEAFDTRAASKEEVQSLGAKFVEVEGATDDKGAGGYAVEQSEEYKQKQKALIFEKITKADVVITTAQLRGKPAPKLVTKEMLDKMKPGSVVVDLASSTGGNCEVTEDNKTVVYNHIYVIGNSELAANMPMHASQLYSKNIHNYIKTFIKEGKLELDFENEIVSSSCITHDGNILYQNPIPKKEVEKQ
ncbi:Re/Si-specific NAD(P)(+) transhydrogenase subunit alpha [Flexithrix dorotheae]|uniref:Re/Si-specific NAD(P)(+) transhydrogenase subunit alpha n=1 Tax=Flexithrix dorotheae TaxID=70993 RepID=UPI00036473FB|nr:Re/Si-specific NAD(P)(+) transhydrogenase subunit alpha [Flexithrix dorotheae]